MRVSYCTEEKLKFVWHKLLLGRILWLTLSVNPFHQVLWNTPLNCADKLSSIWRKAQRKLDILPPWRWRLQDIMEELLWYVECDIWRMGCPGCGIRRSEENLLFDTAHEVLVFDMSVVGEFCGFCWFRFRWFQLCLFRRCQFNAMFPFHFTGLSYSGS